MTLAVFVPVLGAPSETFIAAHVRELAPGRTVVVTRRPAPANGPRWTADVPVLELDVLGDDWGGAEERGAVKRFLAEHGVTAVLLEYLDVWLPFLDTIREAGVPARVAHGHGYDVSIRLGEAWWREQYRAYDGWGTVVTMSEASSRRLTAEVPLPRDAVAVVPYGVDVPDAATSPPGGPEIRCLAVGRLVAKKAPVTTVTAFAAAAREEPRLRLVLGGDGPLAGAVAAAVARERLGDRVTLTGPLPHTEVLERMRGCDLFLQHSVTDPATGDQEGLPVAILEAMAHGLPVVSTRHAGIPEAVADGETGLLVDEGDTEAMGAAILALARDPERRAAFGRRGREVVATRFGRRAEIDRLRELLAIA